MKLCRKHPHAPIAHATSPSRKWRECSACLHDRCLKAGVDFRVRDAHGDLLYSADKDGNITSARMLDDPSAERGRREG